MTVYHELFEVESPARPTFFDVTSRVQEIISRSGVTNGIVVVFSQHTTCSIIIQEEAHDTTYQGAKYILQDLLDVFEKIIPTCRHEGQYMHPGPQHAAYAVDTLGELAEWSLNTDAHLRSCIIGRSESIPLLDGKMELGQFGLIYFVDFDGTRPRKRNVRVQIVGE